MEEGGGRREGGKEREVRIKDEVGRRKCERRKGGSREEGLGSRRRGSREEGGGEEEGRK